MAIPRRLIAVALSAAAAGALLYVSSRMRQSPRKSAVDEANDEKERAAAGKRRVDDQQGGEKSGAEGAERAPGTDAGAARTSSTASSTTSSSSSAPASSAPSGSQAAGAQQELALFLAGDAWHDEIGWQALWEKEGVASSSEWLRTRGRTVLVSERQKLAEHPALLAGCRRRWIVVCRYAGIDVGDAANLWNQSESG
jgi:hypothetical protein